MEQYPQRSSSSGAAALITGIAVLFVIVVALAIALAGVWFVRVSHARQEALVQSERALVQEALAREALEAQMLSQRANGTEAIVLSIDSDGNVELGEQVVSIDELKSKLGELAAEDELRVKIDVHEQCPASVVVQVSQICKEAGAAKVELNSIDDKTEVDSVKEFDTTP